MKRGMARIEGILLVVVALGALAGCGSSSEGSAETERERQGAAVPKATEAEALATYQGHLEEEAALLVDHAELLENRVVVERPASRVQAAYGVARVAYGHLLPIVYLLPGLEVRINGHAGERSGGGLTGFHAIEPILYGRESIEGLRPLAERFVADVRRLRREIETAEPRTLPLARASVRLMREVSGRMIEGREEPYARTDLADVSAGLEGTEAAFEAVKPRLAASDPALARKVEAAFAEAYERLSEHGAPARHTRGWDAGTFYVPYSGMDRRELREVSEPLDSLTRLYGEAAARLQAP